jgi:hypothetical protein
LPPSATLRRLTSQRRIYNRLISNRLEKLQ